MIEINGSKFVFTINVKKTINAKNLSLNIFFKSSYMLYFGGISKNKKK